MKIWHFSTPYITLFVEYFSDICIITQAAVVVKNIGNIDDNNKQLISYTIQLKRFDYMCKKCISLHQYK